MPVGRVSGVEPELIAPGARAGTARLPRRASLASRVVSVDKKNLVVEAPAGDWLSFLVVSFTEMVEPALSVPEVAEAGRSSQTTKSGPIRIVLEETVALLFSLDSVTTLPASARAMM